MAILVLPVLVFTEPSPRQLAAYEFLMYYLYVISLEWAVQQTLGKALLGIKVVGKEGRKAKFSQIVLRNLGKIVSALPLGYGFFRILSPEHHQTIHDEIASCWVIRKVKNANNS